MTIGSTNLKAVEAARKDAEYKGLLPVFDRYHPDITFLVASSQELDWPFDHVPDNLVCCGPILRAMPDVETVSEKLHQWLRKGRTILVNLGSHIKSEPSDAMQMARAFASILNRDKKLQLLWKFTYPGDSLDPSITEILGPAMKEDRVIIERWLDVEPLAILLSKDKAGTDSNFAVMVHHGGANSFYETVKAGVPHVVLPVWFDTYDYANRAEYLGIGIWASKKTAPRIYCNELTNALSIILEDDERGRSIRAKAAELGVFCQKTEGREVAADKVMAMLGS
ncbi:hypothetical protein MMC25_000081 [Agyrium rufum]|nr:hypothetical protein [Agyrium rufum]